MAQKTEAEASTSDHEARTASPDASALDDQQAQARKKSGLRADIARRRAALKQQEAERTLPTQILYIILNSVGAAVVVSMVTALVLSKLPGNSAFADPEIGRLMLFMSFLIGFLFTLLLLMRRLPPNWWQLANEIATTEKYRAPTEKWGGALKDSETSYAPLFDMTRKISEVPPSLSLGTDDEPFSQQPPSQQSDAEEPAADAAPAEPQALFTGAEHTEGKSAETKTEEALAQAKAQAIAEIDRFTKSLTEALQSAARTLDAVSRFALQLYLAGACSAVARKFLLSAKDSLALMVRSLMQAGSGKAFAESFTTNIEEYARRDAYRDVIARGQNAMEAQLNGKMTPVSDAFAAFDTWATDANKALVPRVVTFMFTDIVDASALTQRLGNLHAQRVIKAHDEAVNDGVERHKGKKIKHTGDGMIVTFPDPARAVAAAQSIQQKIDAHNKRLPHLSVNVRIAINAGEAVEQDGVFFGATVRMTAQICDMAKAGQILTAEVIKTFCKSLQQAFKPFSEITIAELDKTRPVFEVVWMKSGAGVEYSDIGHTAA